MDALTARTTTVTRSHNLVLVPTYKVGSRKSLEGFLLDLNDPIMARMSCSKWKIERYLGRSSP